MSGSDERSMGPAPDFRRATAQDLDAVHRLQVDAIRHGTGGEYDSAAVEAWAGAFNREGFAEKVERHEVWIAEVRSRMVGYVSFDPATFEIDSVYVAPEAAGAGIGRAMMEHILNVAREHRIENVWLDASRNAVPFYERLGFVTMEEVVRKPCGVSVRCTRMARLVR